MCDCRFSRTVWTCLLGIFLCCSAAENASGQLLPLRVWTSSNGKKLAAELLDFGTGNDKGKVLLRIKGGAVFKIDPKTLIREDQAQILKARLDRSFRSHFQEDEQKVQFYPKNIPRPRDRDAVTAYLGCDRLSCWLSLRAGVDSKLLWNGNAVIFDGKKTGLVRIPYNEDDIKRARRGALVDLPISRHVGKLQEIFNDKEGMKVMIEKGPKSYSTVPISSQERAGLIESVSAYLAMMELSSDHVWWSVYQELDPAQITQLKIDRGLIKAPVQEVREELSEIREWTLNGGETLSAMVVGFDRHRVILELEQEEVEEGAEEEKDVSTRKFAVEDLSADDRQFLAEVRMNRTFAMSWHPYDERFRWFWPKKWVDKGLNVRISQPTILFAIERASGKPQLIFQQSFSSDEEALDLAVVGTGIQSKSVTLDLSFNPSKAMKLRSTKSSHLWFPLHQDVAELLTTASPAIEQLEHWITIEGQDKITADLVATQFDYAIEAIEVYRIWNSLLER